MHKQRGVGERLYLAGALPARLTNQQAWNHERSATPSCMNAGILEGMQVTMEIITLQGQGKVPATLTDPALAFDTWGKGTAIMEKHNEPWRFIAFIGYEWTSNFGGGNKLRLNVICRDAKDKADQVSPLPTFVTEAADAAADRAESLSPSHSVGWRANPRAPHGSPSRSWPGLGPASGPI